MRKVWSCMNKKISIGLAISIAAIVAVISVTITYTFAMRKFEERMGLITDRQFAYAMLGEIEAKVRQKYDGDIDYDKLLESMADGLMESLGDDQCEYLSADDYERESNGLAGYDFGLGIDVSRASDGNILVNRVQGGSSAATAGMKKGDIITYVNGVTVLSTGYDKAIATISEAKTEVTLKVLRGDTAISFNVSKASFAKVPVEYSNLSGVGYITIYDFNERTDDHFNSAYSTLKSAGITGLIIDLRSVSGGSLAEYESACSILDTLLPQGNLMTFVDSEGNSKVLYTSDSKSTDLKMVILVNGDTAGAAELFASAVYDYGKCYIVGTATSGQMTVQEYFELSDGSAIKLTTGTWKTDTCSAIADGKISTGGFFYNVPLSTYQETNRYVLKPEEDPQISTALDLLATQKDDTSSQTPTTTTAAPPTTTTTTAPAPTTTTTTAAAQ